ncbi:4Fe-4S dicluster domain-containing protein [Streptomyces thermocarboxydus]
MGCGACVAACPNGAAMLFTSAKINHLNVLPQGAPSGRPGCWTWWRRWTRRASAAAPSPACATACPKGIPLTSITGMNKEWLRATRKAGKR